jgi:hypothetical protein
MNGPQTQRELAKSHPDEPGGAAHALPSSDEEGWREAPGWSSQD